MNLGPDGVTGANVRDLVPGALRFASWTCTPSGGASCSLSGVPDIDDLVDLPAGGSVRFTISGIVDTGADSFDNTATAEVPPGVVDPNGANDSATVTVNTCIGEEMETFTNLAIGSPTLFVASEILFVGMGVTVLPEGDLILRSCGTVVLGDGFSILSGGTLTVQTR